VGKAELDDNVLDKHVPVGGRGAGGSGVNGGGSHVNRGCGAGWCVEARCVLGCCCCALGWAKAGAEDIWEGAESAAMLPEERIGGRVGGTRGCGGTGEEAPKKNAVG